MGISVKIHNVKNIDDFEFEIPTQKGLYALTGENGSGKSTVISCAAAAFYVPSFYDYFGNPREGAFIEFKFDGKSRSVREKDGRWQSPAKTEFLGITGFYEGSIVFGNRFKDIDYSLLGKLASVEKSDLEAASDFVKKSLGNILHDDETYYKRLLSNKRVLVIAVGGWTQVLRFAYDTIRSNLALSTTKILIILDRDIKDSVPGFLRNEHIGFSIEPNYLPIKSLEKYLMDKLTKNIDTVLFRELNDYLFQGKSLDAIIKDYFVKEKTNQYKDSEKINNGKMLYETLNHELRQIRKTESDLVAIIVDYLFRSESLEVNELTAFLEDKLK